MSLSSVKNFSQAEEKRTPEKTLVEVVEFGNQKVLRITFQPGWDWSKCIMPVAGTDTCQAHHVGVVQSGEIQVQMNDGTILDLKPGCAYLIEPGHTAHVVGDEPCITYEFENNSA